MRTKTGGRANKTTFIMLENRTEFILDNYSCDRYTENLHYINKSASYFRTGFQNAYHNPTGIELLLTGDELAWRQQCCLCG